jgi:hypothetical protein
MEFSLTPTYIDMLGPIYRNPKTGYWMVPVLTFEEGFIPFYIERDVLNEDPNYHKNVVRYFYLQLTEKWLYHDPIFFELTKYFRLDKEDGKIRVSLVTDPNRLSPQASQTERNYVLKYIEKFFVTKKLVEHVLRKYVARHHVKWYDLFYNKDRIKREIAHKLQKIIVQTIQDLQRVNLK